MNPNPSVLDLLAFGSDTVPVLPVLSVVLAALYLSGVSRLRRAGRKWSAWRTISFLLGCILLLMTTGLALEAYSHILVSVFMFQQLTLMMLIPPLLVMGCPGTLLLRATRHHGVGALVLNLAHAGLRSRLARWILSPFLSIPLYLLLFYGLYLGNLADPILGTTGGHLFLEILFLASGMIFTIPVLSTDPLPIRMSYAGRALDVFIEAALHAFFGVFLMISTNVFVTKFIEPTIALGMDPLADQEVAGGLAWSYGEAPTLVMLIIIMHRWFRDDTRRAKAHDRFTDVHGDADLDAYNAHLKKLAENDTAAN